MYYLRLFNSYLYTLRTTVGRIASTIIFLIANAKSKIKKNNAIFSPNLRQKNNLVLSIYANQNGELGNQFI